MTIIVVAYVDTCFSINTEKYDYYVDPFCTQLFL
jgi:hypothetical protein